MPSGGSTCPSTLTAVTGGDKSAGLEHGGGIKLKAFRVPREGEKEEDPRPESATGGPAPASEVVDGGGAPDEEMRGEAKRRNRKRPAMEAGVEGSEQEPKEPRVEEETADEPDGEPSNREEGGGEVGGGMAVDPPQEEETSEVNVAPMVEDPKAAEVEDSQAAEVEEGENQQEFPDLAAESPGPSHLRPTGKEQEFEGSRDGPPRVDVIIKEVGILVKYPHIGKSYVLSDEEFLRRWIDVKMTSIYSSDRESGEELMRRLEVLKGLKSEGTFTLSTKRRNWPLGKTTAENQKDIGVQTGYSRGF